MSTAVPAVLAEELGRCDLQHGRSCPANIHAAQLSESALLRHTPAGQHAVWQAALTCVTAPADAPAAAGLRPKTPEPPALPTSDSAKNAPPLSSISTGVVAAATYVEPGQSDSLLTPSLCHSHSHVQAAGQQAGVC